ncbi:RNA polymerase sigma factor (sigma-70 family) [Kutzneria viridogrisea]|uniref:RNA polymerase, sigma-24 subunit, ECF subfamily n=2 Tax=Kutzneria TaxID=43356 RepID=W5W025_9PSEU|nr:sigma-70 family RNA polymerase sigma factor [Kutzneria albida]AHH93901.1 RNA polymerase, sigma-24 subunit, ECF subfamily [Kutzneria albida DSM 43870]MBA8931094.1 RNA polymerase sigma factor (sigma-70 family) [Kutzneria viridogrisea]
MAVDTWEGLSGHDRHAACLVAAQGGNRRALDTLVTDLTPLVWHVTRSQGLDRVSAEDVVQTVWLALLRHLNRLEHPRALAGWLITTTRREAQRARTTGYDRESPVPNEGLSDIPTQNDGPEQEALRDDRDRRLWAAYAQLTERCQHLLKLTVLAGRAQYDAVAEALHMPRGSIGPTRGRCLNQLRDLLNREGGPQ